MPRYKRTREEAELDILLEPEVQPPQDVETLTRLRNMWEFASLMQYIFLFGHAVKLDDDLDIEDLEAECLKPQPSEKLAQMGLAMLKYVSSHRGLTPDIFDEYTRRQYVAKAPLRNPFGDEEEPLKFNDFDVFQKIRVLQQLSTWTLGNASRIRELMPDDEDQLNWRMEPLGWDKEDRAYFVLDDNRLYRRTDAPPPPPTPKLKGKKKTPKKPKSRGTRTSKRRKIEDTSDDEVEEQEAGEQEDTVMTNGDHTVVAEEEEAAFGFTNKTWECVAITLEEYNDFLATILRSRDANEKQLRKGIEDDVLPIIEKRAEALRQKQMKRLRELENLQKMASAKRSGRLAEKAEKEKQDREEREVEEKKLADLRMAHEEQERQRRIEEGHESRRLTREQRLKDREVKRILHEEELARLEEDAKRASSQDPTSDSAAEGKRISERQIKTQRAQHKKELEKLAEDEDKWYFDCSVCGMHGENLDDGTHSVACERCDVWQHSKCHNFSPKQVEKEGFHFVCAPCKRKEKDAKKPKIPPLKLKKKESASPETQKNTSRPSSSAANGARSVLPDHVERQLDGRVYPPPHFAPGPPGPYGQISNGPSLSPFGQAQGPPGYRYPPVGNFAPHPHQAQPQQPWRGSPLPPPPRPSSSGYAVPSPMTNGYSSPPQHQQQHQSMHHNAVAASGGHPPHASYQTQGPQNSHSPRAPAGMYSMTLPPPQQALPPQYYQSNANYYGQQGPPQRPGSGHLLNGFQSPNNSAAKPVSSPQQPYQVPYNSANPLRQQPHHISHSPNPHFAPTYDQQGVHSPVKPSRSPNMAQPQGAPYQRPLAPSPNHQTAQHPYAGQAFRPPSSNGMQPPYQTPQQQAPRMQAHQGNPSPAGANSNHIAADGMSGPWPEGSKSIPQKHDRSPAPPPLPTSQSPQIEQQSQALADSTVQQTPAAPQLNRRMSQGTQTQMDGKITGPSASMPPVALSPSQQQVQQATMTGPATVPVKKPIQSPQPSETAHLGGANAVRAPQADIDLAADPASDAAKLQAAARLAADVLTEQKSDMNGNAVEQTQQDQQTSQGAQPGAAPAQT